MNSQKVTSPEIAPKVPSSPLEAKRMLLSGTTSCINCARVQRKLRLLQKSHYDLKKCAEKYVCTTSNFYTTYLLYMNIWNDVKKKNVRHFLTLNGFHTSLLAPVCYILENQLNFYTNWDTPFRKLCGKVQRNKLKRRNLRIVLVKM